MTREELERRIRLRRRWEWREAAVFVGVPILLFAAVGWSDLWAGAAYRALSEAALAAITWATLAAGFVIMLVGNVRMFQRSRFRAQGLLCPHCDARLWPTRKLAQTAACRACGGGVAD